MIKRDDRQIKSHDPPDRRHAGRLAHEERQAVDPAGLGRADPACCERVVTTFATGHGRRLYAAAGRTRRSSGWWDEFRIEQVVVNLLTNALRYGGQQPVDVTLLVEQDWVRIEVRDQGPGVAPEQQEKIFEPYERGVGNEVPSGLGLGLYISRQLAEVHEGSLTLRSKPGEGAVFSLALPRRDAPPM
jgi:signal transduction histidine kinase